MLWLYRVRKKVEIASVKRQLFPSSRVASSEKVTEPSFSVSAISKVEAPREYRGPRQQANQQGPAQAAASGYNNYDLSGG